MPKIDLNLLLVTCLVYAIGISVILAGFFLLLRAELILRFFERVGSKVSRKLGPCNNAQAERDPYEFSLMSRHSMIVTYKICGAMLIIMGMVWLIMYSIVVL